MANNFEFRVLALDGYTKVLRDLNNKASKAARPFVNVHRQVGALAREMHLDKAAKGMGKVSDAAITLSRTLGLSLGPLEAVLGAGGIVGGLLAAAGGAVALGVNFARTGFDVARTSQAIGMSTRDLQRWRGAAELAGVDSAAMNETLRSLGTTLEDAKFSRNMVALRALRALHIGIPQKNGVVDQNAALEQIGTALSKISDPQYRDVLAKALNIDPRVIPLLAQGADGIHRMQDEAEKYGIVLDTNAIQQTERFTKSLNRLKVQAEGAGLSLGASFLPPLQSVVDTISKGVDTGGLRGGIAKVLQSVPGNPLARALGLELGLFTSPGTTVSQRTVSGQIGGPLQQGTYVKPAADSASAASAIPQGAARRGGALSPAEKASLSAFSPEEIARQQANEDSEENRRELLRELQRPQTPAARAVLQDEVTKMEQRLHITLTLDGIPPGVGAKARVASTDIPNATARVQFAMPTGDMP